ncbi:MAG: hypothetical protein ACLRWP_21160 [Bilophila wadsworthia]
MLPGPWRVAVRAMACVGPTWRRLTRQGTAGFDLRNRRRGCGDKALQGKFVQPDEIRQHAEDVMRDFGGIDVVINTAGGNVKGAYYRTNEPFDLTRRS